MFRAAASSWVPLFFCVARDGGKMVMIDRRECVLRVPSSWPPTSPIGNRQSAPAPDLASTHRHAKATRSGHANHHGDRPRSPPRRPHLPSPGVVISATLPRDRNPAMLWASRPPRFALSAKRFLRSSLPGSKGRADLALLELHDGSRFLAHRPRMTPAFD